MGVTGAYLDGSWNSLSVLVGESPGLFILNVLFTEATDLGLVTSFMNTFFNKLIRSFRGFKVFKNRSVLLQFPSLSFKPGFLPIQFFIFLFCKIEDPWANAKTESVCPWTGICPIATVCGVQWVLHAACPIPRSVSRIHSHHNHSCLNHTSSSSLKSSKRYLVLNCPSKFGQGEYSAELLQCLLSTSLYLGSCILSQVPLWTSLAAPDSCSELQTLLGSFLILFGKPVYS